MSTHGVKVYEAPQPLKIGGWESEHFCQWPQEVILRLEKRAQLQHMVLMSKEDRSIPGCQVYVGDGISGSFHECPFRHAGNAEHIGSTVAKQFTVLGIGNFIKIVIQRGPGGEGRNPAGSVSIGLLKVFGQPMEYHSGIVNQEQPVLKG